MRVHRLDRGGQQLINEAIEAIKTTGGLASGQQERLHALGVDLARTGVDSIIIGCTELSTLAAIMDRCGLRAVDSNRALARAALARLGLAPSQLKPVG